MKRRHYLGVSMARRVDVVRPRSERDIPTERLIAYAPRPHDPPRRLTPTGRLVVAALAVGALAFAVFYVLGRIGGNS